MFFTNISYIFSQDDDKKEVKNDTELSAVFMAENHVRLPPINMSIVRKNGVAGQLQVIVLIECESKKIHEELYYISPVIVDCMIDRLWRVFSVLWTTGTKPDQAIIKNHLNIAISKIKNLPNVKNIHISQIFIAVPIYGPYRKQP